MAKKQIIINTAGGLVQEVLTNFDVEADFEVVLVEFDNEDCEHMSKHYDTNVLDNDQWVQFPTISYKDRFMEAKEYHVGVIVTVPDCYSKEHAIQETKARLGSMYVDLTHEPEPEPNDNTLIVECCICGIEEEINFDDDPEWHPEVYLGDTSMDACCPRCVEDYCMQDDEGLLDIDLSKIEFTSIPGSPLAAKIAKRFTQSK